MCRVLLVAGRTVQAGKVNLKQNMKKLMDCKINVSGGETKNGKSVCILYDSVSDVAKLMQRLAMLTLK